MKTDKAIRRGSRGMNTWHFWKDRFKNKTFSQPEDGVRIWRHKLRDNPLPNWKLIKSPKLADYHEWTRHSLGPILFVFFSECLLPGLFLFLGYKNFIWKKKKNLLCSHLDSCIEFFPTINQESGGHQTHKRPRTFLGRVSSQHGNGLRTVPSPKLTECWA